MFRLWLALAIFGTGTARGAGPTYSAAGIVNASNYSAGPFAPGSVVSIFGASLARSTAALGAADMNGAMLPFELNYVRVYVQDQPAPILFVSAAQINFILSTVQLPGPVRVRVVTEGISGPEVVITVVDAAPALFVLAEGYAIATSADGKLLTPDNPARVGDIIVVYATGLGRTQPNPAPGEVPSYAAPIVAMPALKVTLEGKPIDPMFVKYAGLTPKSAGLYQINIEVPPGTAAEPPIEITAGSPVPFSGLKLAIR